MAWFVLVRCSAKMLVTRSIQETAPSPFYASNSNGADGPEHSRDHTGLESVVGVDDGDGDGDGLTVIVFWTVSVTAGGGGGAWSPDS